jgi:hypothetical protein
MAPPEKKKNGYDMGGIRDIENMYSNELQNSAVDMLNEASKLKKAAESMYKTKSSEINKRRFLGRESMDVLKDLIKSYVPNDEKKNFYKNVGYLNSDANNALKDLKKYSEYTERLSKLISEYNRENDPMSRSRNKNSHVAVEMKHEMENVRMEMVKSIESFKTYETKVNQLSGELAKVMTNYALKKKNPEKESHVSNMMLIVFSAVFGMSVLWALTQTRPESVTIGAFVAGGETSPILLSMLTGTVIFLAFFLSHHKLK